MKYLITTFLAFTLTSCETKKPIDNNPIKKPKITDTTKLRTNKVAIDNELISLLINKQIITTKYPEANLKLLNKTVLDDSCVFSGIQFPYDSTLLNTYESELIFNALVLYEKNKVLNTLVIDAVYEEDFNFITSSKKFIVYEFYSSPVGYTIYYILNSSNQKLFKSEPIEEGFSIDTSSINFRNNTISATFNEKNKSYSLKNLW